MFALDGSCTDFEKAKAKIINLFQKTQCQKSPKPISIAFFEGAEFGKILAFLGIVFLLLLAVGSLRWIFLPLLMMLLLLLLLL